MGWSDFGDGQFGDGPADVAGDAMDAIAAKSRARGDALPTGESILRAFVATLALDGTLAPFYAEPKLVTSITVNRRGTAVRLDATGAEPWIVLELFEMLELIAEEYQEAWDRPPSLAELVAYLRIHLEKDDTQAWTLVTATFKFGKRKPKDRGTPPKV